MHILDVSGTPLVHLTRSTRPEIVLFGTEHPLDSGLRAEAGSSIVVVVDGGTANISRFVAGQPDRNLDAPARVDAVARAIIAIGGTYPDLVQFLQQASSSRCLGSRLAFDAVPNEFDGRGTVHDEASTHDRDESDREETEPEAPANDDTAQSDKLREGETAAGIVRAGGSS